MCSKMLLSFVHNFSLDRSERTFYREARKDLYKEPDVNGHVSIDFPYISLIALLFMTGLNLNLNQDFCKSDFLWITFEYIII